MLAAGEAAYLSWVLEPGPIPHSRPELFRRVWEAMEAVHEEPRPSREPLVSRVERPEVLIGLQRVLRRFSSVNIANRPDWANGQTWRDLTLEVDLGIPRSFWARVLHALEAEFGLQVSTLGYSCGDLTVGDLHDAVAAKVPGP
jgi:hypothetical protein